MILELMKRDIGWGALPWLCGLAALAAAIMPIAPFTPFLPAIAVPFYTIIFMRALPHQRATFFEAALPVPARDLLAARFCTFMAMIWPPLAIVCTGLAIRGHSAHTIAAIVATGMALTLVLVAIQSVRLSQFSAPSWMTILCPAAAVILVAPGLATGHAWITTMISGAAAVLLGAYLWNNVPETFQSAPEAASAERISKGAGLVSMPWWPVLRSMWSWQLLVFVPVSVIWVSTSDWIFGTMYMMLAYNQARMNTRWAQALPISKRRIFAFILLPLVFLMAAGTEFGMRLGLSQQNHDLVRLGDPGHFRATGMPDVLVAYQFWRMAPHGEAPEIEAPWGERYRPPAMRILGLSLYNPYAVGADNSERFQQWQFERATSDIFGKAMTARQFAENRRNSFKAITERPRMQILGVAAVIAMTLLWVWLIEFCSWNRLNRLPAAWKTAFTTILILVPIGLALYLDWAVSGPGSRFSRSLMQAALLAVSRHAPENLAVLSALAILPVIGLYWLIERQSAAAEDSQKAQQQSQMGMLGQGWGQLR